jgi:hypothetical protein
MSLHPTAQSRLFRIQSLTFAVDELDVRQNNPPPPSSRRQRETTNIMTDNTKKGYFDENLTFDGIQKTIDDLVTTDPNHIGVITAIGKLGSLMSILHDDNKEQNRLTKIQNRRVEILSWVVGVCTLITTFATIMSICK